MKFTDLFIKKPVVAIVVNLLILILGAVSYFTLNVRQYPRSDSAVVTVNTTYFGASAELVRGFITTPLERVIASVDGIDYMESESKQGISTIKVYLRLNYDTNAALTQISSKIDQVRNDLPPEAELPIINVETSDNQFASMYLSFYSDSLEQNQITDYLLRVVQPKLSAIKGVQKADILGARYFAMRIWLKADTLAAHNLSPAEVRDALAANNYLSAVGTTKGSMIQVNLVANTDLRSVEEFKNLVVKEDNGVIIRLQDVADVVLGAESYEEEVRFDGQKATFMGIWVLPNANSLDVIKAVREAMPTIQKEMPVGLQANIAYDATAYINDALHEILKTLGETLLIVGIVIYLFMGSLRSVIVPLIAMPLSLVGALFLMNVFGFTINLLTLLAIVLAVGLVVDDAIVVVENVERHIRNGMKPKEAAIKGARELFGPIIAMTITLAAVYAPIGFQGGLTGALFREFAITLAGAVAVSGVVALTLSPMMSGALLNKSSEEHGFAGVLNRFFDKVRARYEALLNGSLNYIPVTITLAVLLSLLIGPFAMISMKTLAPREDQGVVFGIIMTAPNSTIDQTVLFTEQVQNVFESVEEYETSFQLTGPNFGFSGILLKPWSERERKAIEIEQSLAGTMARVPGVRVIVTTPPPLPSGGNFPIEFVISSTASHQEINAFAEQLVAKAMEKTADGTFFFVDSDLKFDQPQVEVTLDREKIAAMGLDMRRVGADLGVMLGGGYVNRFNIEGRSYRVIPQVERIERLNPDQLSDYYVRGPQDSLVALSTFATLEESVQPRSLNRFQQLNSVKITGVGLSVDKALKFLEEEADKILPAGYFIDYGGESRQLRTEGSSLLQTMGLAGVMIFLVLAAQFNSFRDPFVILLGSVPLAIFGALLPIFLGNPMTDEVRSINIYSQVGLITLVGLIAKNGILIVEWANKLQEEGISKRAAVLEAASTRLRPILMTSAATIFGHFPLVLVSGPGAASRNSIGLVLVTGMAIGTFFTLFMVPAFYMLFGTNKKHAEKPVANSDEMPRVN